MISSDEKNYFFAILKPQKWTNVEYMNLWIYLSSPIKINNFEQ